MNKQTATEAADTRTVRDILLSIEKKFLPRAEGRQKTFPNPLTRTAREALDIVFDEMKARNERITHGELIDRANELGAELNKDGGTNESIRAYAAEKLGIKVKWAFERVETAPANGDGD